MTDPRSELSEVVNEDWTFDVVRTYVLGVEAFDLNISAMELRLLIMLRIRASGGRNNHVSNETLAKDLGVQKNAIAGYMTNLVKQGYVVCKSRGYGSPTLKTIKSMVTRYDDDILKMTRRDLFGAGRSDELLERLHHPTAGRKPVDSASKSSNTRTGATGGGASSSTRSDTMEARDRVTLEARDRVTEVDKEINQNELDSATCGRDATENSGRRFRKIGHTRSGESYDKDTGEVLDSVVLPTQDPEKLRAMGLDEGDVRQARAMAAAVQAVTRNAKVAHERDEMLLARKAQDERSGLAKTRRLAREEERLANKTAGGRFYEWAQVEYDRFFPTIRMTKWMKTEFSQLKTLREACHNDDVLVRKSWSYLCEHWDELTKKLKLADSAPTIGLLLAIRARIVPLVQERQTDRQYAERSATPGKLGEW
jgi:biotin operon repressor